MSKIRDENCKNCEFVLEFVKRNTKLKHQNSRRKCAELFKARSVYPIDLLRAFQRPFPFSNDNLIAKIGFVTAENESLKVCQKGVRQLGR